VLVALPSFPKLAFVVSFALKHPRLEAMCRSIAAGRTLARQLAVALRDYQLSEAEFRLLWLLSEVTERGTEQNVLAKRLGLSPAQVSATVEKLRGQQVIALVVDPADRRRKLWQLTPSGSKRLQPILAALELAACNWVSPPSLATSGRPAA